jgi:peptidoglycan hydrolase FlgJ
MIRPLNPGSPSTSNSSSGSSFFSKLPGMQLPASAAQPPFSAELAGPMLPPSSFLPNDFERTLNNQHSFKDEHGGAEPLRDAFRDFVGQTLFGQMLSSMRSTVGKPAYFHGGRAEEVFSQQLDQVLVEKITDASASTVADPMFELFNMQRSQ